MSMAIPLKEITTRLEARYPSAWALAGDRVGLQVGHPDTLVSTILVALEASPQVVAEARSRQAQLLLTHHPLLYQPLAEVREDKPAGALLSALIRAGVALFSCHTNLDAAPGGLNDYLAGLLELEDLEVLHETSREALFKLAVFVPAGYEEPVRRALGDAGLGVIGRYSHCSFAGRGQGTYEPLKGARPFRGEVAKLSRAAEVRFEMLAPESLLQPALTLLKEAHPYEEVAYDLYPLKNPGTPLGLGRLGRWPEPRPFGQVVSRVKDLFSVEAVRVWGSPPAAVTRAAVLGGSGGDLIGLAWDKGAQIYVTGEVRHHQVPSGEMAGFAVLEVGHFQSEAVFMAPWAEALRDLFQQAGLPVRVEVAQSMAAPSRYL